MIKQVKTTLLCSNCLEESPFLLTYLGDSLIKMECLKCGYTSKIASEEIHRAFLRDWTERVSTKPLRLACEFERDTLSFCLGLPIRILTKPLRVANELTNL